MIMSIDCLYKYRKLDRYSIQIFVKRELYFAKAYELNDPYEISLPITFEGTDDQIKAKLASVASLGISPTEENVRDAKNPDSDLRKKLEKHAEEDLKETRERFGICSFSEVNDNILTTRSIKYFNFC